ncbi:MAG: helix-turn-helix domain-containing protein [Bacteroidales bacterium]|nr:helix-turn-helix domain-containing protein [Bacteroidales bacterium]
MDESLSLDQAFIKKLTDIILSNLENEHFGVEELLCEMGMSHTTIHRKLRSYTRLSISQFIREVRLHKAHEMLQQNLGNVSEISYRVGFGSPTYFNKCFHEYYGYPPGEVKRIESRINNPNTDKPDLLHHAELRSGQNKITTAGPWNKNYKNILVISLGILAGLLVAWFLYLTFTKSRNTSAETESIRNEKSIAILSFKNLSGDADNQYFADGVTIDIRDHLSRIKGLKVKSGTTSDQFRGSTLTIPEIAKKIGVNYILEGSAQTDNSRTRVSVKLFDAKRDRQLLSETFDRDLSDIFSVQSEIAQIVAAKLEAVLSSEEIEQIEKIPTQSTEAHILYLKGRYFWNLRTQESLIKSIECFEQSLTEDPDYALAYAGLADAFNIQTINGWRPAPEGYVKAKDHVHKALEIDKNLAEAHSTLGGILIWGDWQWEEARKELSLAIELNPNYSTAHQYFAELLSILGENEEARIQVDLALELDPYSRTINLDNMLIYYNQGKFHEALKAWNEVNEMGLTFFNPYPYYFYIYMYLGEDSKAFEALHHSFLNNPLNAKYAETLKEVYNRSGVKGILNWLNDSELTKSDSFKWYIAKRYTILGRNGEALDFLEKAFLERDWNMPYIYNSYDFRNLRNEPRFRAILRQMNFPEYKSQAPGSD